MSPLSDFKYILHINKFLCMSNKHLKSNTPEKKYWFLLYKCIAASPLILSYSMNDAIIHAVVQDNNSWLIFFPWSIIKLCFLSITPHLLPFFFFRTAARVILLKYKTFLQKFSMFFFIKFRTKSKVLTMVYLTLCDPALDLQTSILSTCLLPNYAPVILLLLNSPSTSSFEIFLLSLCLSLSLSRQL